MDEAERLCDRVAIMDHGKVIALGTPQQLIASIGGEEIVEFAVCAAPAVREKTNAAPSARVTHATFAQDDGEDCLPTAVNVGQLTAIPGVQSHRVDAGVHQLSVSELHTAVPRIFAELEMQGLHLSEFRTHSATLEDVFVRLTGRNLRDE